MVDVRKTGMSAYQFAHTLLEQAKVALLPGDAFDLIALLDGKEHELDPVAVDALEIVATGTEEWLELANKGATEIDLSDFGVADTDKATKLPKISGAMRFPAGTRLAAGAYLLVVTNKKKTDPVGPHPKESCVPGAQSICFYATFGISAADGESLYVLTKDNAVIANAQYPASPADAGADAGASGKSVCRKPDKTGELASCDPTPGAANK